MKILILEDYQDLIDLYDNILGPANELTILHSLKDLELLERTKDVSTFDVALCDLKLLDGFFLEWIVKNNSQIIEKVPTIIVSSLDDVNILKTCFEWGAADYLIKPFNRNEIVPKVAKAQRNYQISEGSFTEEALLDEFTIIERKIFQQFLKRPGEYLGREMIVKEVWKKVQVNPKNFDVHLSNLRKKLQKTNWSIEHIEARGWALVRKY